MCLVSICFSIVCAYLTHFQIWLLPRHSLTQRWKLNKKKKKGHLGILSFKIFRFHVVSDKKKCTANYMFLNARSQQSFRGAMPAENAAVLTDTGSHRTQVQRQETLPPTGTCLQMLWFQLPTLLHAKVCGLAAFCANTVGCQFLSCTSWYARLGQGGDLCKELNQNVPFSLHTPHQSFLNNNKRKFL